LGNGLVVLVVGTHEVGYFHHFSEVMGYVLLVVNAEEAVRDVVVYFLLIVFECLDQSNMRFHSLRRLLELAKLLLEGVEGRFESVV
jgi:hypothetical protein